MSGNSRSGPLLARGFRLKCLAPFFGTELAPRLCEDDSASAEILALSGPRPTEAWCGGRASPVEFLSVTSVRLELGVSIGFNGPGGQTNACRPPQPAPGAKAGKLLVSPSQGRETREEGAELWRRRLADPAAVARPLGIGGEVYMHCWAALMVSRSHEDYGKHADELAA